MAKIEMAIRDAIARGARKHIRSAATPLRRDVRRLRQAVRELRAQVAALREVAARWTESQARVAVAARGVRGGGERRPAVAGSHPEAPPAPRPQPGRGGAPGGGEPRGRRAVGAGPRHARGKNRAALVGLRRLGRRQAKRLLASAAAERAKPQRPPARRAGVLARPRSAARVAVAVERCLPGRLGAPGVRHARGGFPDASDPRPRVRRPGGHAARGAAHAQARRGPGPRPDRGGRASTSSTSTSAPGSTRASSRCPLGLEGAGVVEAVGDRA